MTKADLIAVIADTAEAPVGAWGPSCRSGFHLHNPGCNRARGLRSAALGVSRCVTTRPTRGAIPGPETWFTSSRSAWLSSKWVGNCVSACTRVGNENLGYLVAVGDSVGRSSIVVHPGGCRMSSIDRASYQPPAGTGCALGQVLLVLASFLQACGASPIHGVTAKDAGDAPGVSLAWDTAQPSDRAASPDSRPASDPTSEPAGRLTPSHRPLPVAPRPCRGIRGSRGAVGFSIDTGGWSW